MICFGFPQRDAFGGLASLRESRIFVKRFGEEKHHQP
jgi:hypothetical protein